MKYLLTCWHLGGGAEIEIEKEKFEDIKIAKEILIASLAIEEKYELLLSNYIEFENELLNSSTDFMVRRSSDLSGYFDIRLLFNRRIVNLLTSTKLYIDQASSHIKNCFSKKEDIGQKVKSYFSEEYDKNFEYRFLEALRNYVQHRGLAVHLTSQHMSWKPPIKHEKLEFSQSLFSKKTDLMEDKVFKAQVLDEMPDEVELIHAVRSYISSLSRIHGNNRELLAKKSEWARDILEKVIHDYELQNEGDSIALSVVIQDCVNSKTEIIKKIPISLEWDNIRLKMVKTNQVLNNLEQRYVSGMPHKERSK